MALADLPYLVRIAVSSRAEVASIERHTIDSSKATAEADVETIKKLVSELGPERDYSRATHEDMESALVAAHSIGARVRRVQERYREALAEDGRAQERIRQRHPPFR